MSKESNISLIRGDCLRVLPDFLASSFDGLITDPPYSSGGSQRVATTQSTAKKYTSTKRDCPYPDFEGDSKDARSWTNWAAEWLGLARDVCKPGAVAAVFVDWRQLPNLTDALQWAGWTWRGIVTWDKTNAVPA